MAKDKTHDPVFEISFFESILRRDPNYSEVIEILGGLYTKVGRISDGLRMDRRLAPALEIWGQVLSRPEPGLAFLGLGKRDAGHDLGLPVPAFWARPGTPGAPRPTPGTWRITTLYDQHARLELPAEAELQVGDLVGCGVNHPCTSFDKWQVLFEVDDTYKVLGAIRTFF